MLHFSGMYVFDKLADISWSHEYDPATDEKINLLTTFYQEDEYDIYITVTNPIVGFPVVRVTISF